MPFVLACASCSSGVATCSDFAFAQRGNCISRLSAPKQTTADIIDKLNREINSAHADSKTQRPVADPGGVSFPG